MQFGEASLSGLDRPPPRGRDVCCEGSSTKRRLKSKIKLKLRNLSKGYRSFTSSFSIKRFFKTRAFVTLDVVPFKFFAFRNHIFEVHLNFFQTRPFEYLRLTSLGVIGALVKTDEQEVGILLRENGGHLSASFTLVAGCSDFRRGPGRR